MPPIPPNPPPSPRSPFRNRISAYTRRPLSRAQRIADAKVDVCVAMFFSRAGFAVAESPIDIIMRTHYAVRLLLDERIPWREWDEFDDERCEGKGGTGNFSQGGEGPSR